MFKYKIGITKPCSLEKRSHWEITAHYICKISFLTIVLKEVLSQISHYQLKGGH